MKKIAVIFLLLFSLKTDAQSFFVPTTYRGAFGSSDWTTTWTNWTPKNTSYPAGTVTITGDITSNTTWTSDKTYFLKGYVYVKNNAVLTIQPGTIIRCDVLSSSTLIICRGAKINAVGTPASPIVFTSSEAAGSRTYGDWGGLVLLGNGKINAAGGVADVGAGINNTKGDGLYGGSNDNDSSGIIKYLRIEFAGIQYQPDKEIPSLTLAGVGAKTEIDYIQISYCGNDGLHLAGGMGRVKHLVMHRGYDTDISMDLGYRGLLQFGIILRDSTKSNASGTSGMEIQNDGLASSAQPFTDPTISNFTILGPMTATTTPYSSGYRNGIHIRRNGKCALFNTAIAGYPRGIMLDGQGAAQHMKDGNITVEACLLAGNKIKQVDTTGNSSSVLPGFDFLTWVKTATFYNTLLTAPKDLKLADPYSYNSPTFIPRTGSPLNSGAAFTNLRLNNTEVKTSYVTLPGLQILQSGNTLQICCLNVIKMQQLNLAIMDYCGRIICTKNMRDPQETWQLPEFHGPAVLIISDTNGKVLEVRKMLF